jgi:hypothetical protein
MSTPVFSERFESVDVSNPSGLSQLDGLLHDEYVDLEEISYDEAGGILDIPFRRIWHNGRRRIIKNRFFYRIEEIDILRGSLRFLNVISFHVNDPERIGRYTFNYFRYDDVRELITVYCDPNCELSIGVHGIHAQYRELEYRGKSRIKRGWFWDAESCAWMTDD